MKGDYVGSESSPIERQNGPANQISVKRSVTKRSQSTDGQGKRERERERANDWAGERLPDARQKASSEDNEVK